jgi:hypothetical protein
MSRDTGLASAFDGMMSRIVRHHCWQTSVAAIAAHDTSLSLSA